jgi:hypothetical protein
MSSRNAVGFPPPTQVGDTHTIGEVEWTWNGSYWVQTGSTGGGGGGGGIEEAPKNGKLHARQDESWHEFDPGNLEPGNADGETLAWSTADAEWMPNDTLIVKGGNVGIGTISSNAPLTVSRGAAENGLVARLYAYEASITDRGLEISTDVSGGRVNSEITYNAASGAATGQHVWQTDGTERMRIAANGRVDITGPLYVNGSEVGSGGGGGLPDGGYTYGWTITAADFVATSDERLKEDIAPLPVGLIDDIKPVQWNWKDGSGKSAGVIAQQLQAIGLDDFVTEGDDGHLGVNYNALVGVLLAEVISLKAEVEALK